MFRPHRGITFLACIVILSGLGCSGSSAPQQAPATVDKAEQTTPDASPSAESPAESATDTPSTESITPADDKAIDHKPTQSALGAITLKPVTVAEYSKVIDSLKGKVVLVDFWATWCFPCRKEFPNTVRWNREYADKGLAVVSVAMDQPDKTTQKRALQFLQQQQADFTNLASKLGGNDDAMEAFEIDGGALPHYKLYDRQGKTIRTFSTGDPEHAWKSEDVEAALKQAIGS